MQRFNNPRRLSNAQDLRQLAGLNDPGFVNSHKVNFFGVFHSPNPKSSVAADAAIGREDLHFGIGEAFVGDPIIVA